VKNEAAVRIWKGLGSMQWRNALP